MNILMLDNGLPFNLETPYHEPLGGSESSFLFLAKGLSEIGHKIILLTTSTKSVPEYSNNLILHNIQNYKSVIEQSDVIILNRCIIPEILDSNKKIYYYSHDAFDQNHILFHFSNTNIINRFEKILCVSEWQKNTFNKYYNIPLEKMEVIYNSFDPFIFDGHIKRNENQLIFASIPYKGIEVLPDICHDILIKSKKDINIKIFSSMNLYKQDDKEYEQYYSDLLKMHHVELNPAVSLKELSFHLMSSSIYIHPNTYHETFGINLIQSQASGCIPITTNLGAVNETIINNETGFIIDEPNIFNISTYNKFIDKILESLDTDLYRMRIKAKEFSNKFSYYKIAKKVETILDNC